MSDQSSGLVEHRRFVYSMKDFGITMFDAINEFIDNSLDADADNIWLSIETNESGGLRLIVEDDGTGIHPDNLKSALRFGGHINQGEGSIGKFGFGLPASAYCQSDVTEIYTKHEDTDSFVRNELNLDELADTGKIPDNDEDVTVPSDSYDFHLPQEADSGTIIILHELRDPEYVKIDTIETHVQEKIGRIQRHALAEDTDIYLNGERLPIHDPLFEMEGSEEVAFWGEADNWAQGSINFNSGEHSGEIEYHLNLLPVKEILKKKKNTREDWGINQENQGLYITRETREIRSGVTLSLFSRHNSLNYFRGEIKFPSELDEAFGVETNKSRCSLSGDLRKELERILGGQIRQIRKELDSRINKAKQELRADEGMETSERIFNDSTRWLPPSAQTPDEQKAREQEEEAKEKIEEIKKKFRNDDIDEENMEDVLEKYKLIRDKDGFVYFKEIEKPNEGSFYGFKRQGKILTTQINPDHRFYSTVYQNLESGEKDSEVLNHMDLLLMAMVKAEDEVQSEEIREFYERHRRSLTKILGDVLQDADSYL